MYTNISKKWKSVDIHTYLLHVHMHVFLLKYEHLTFEWKHVTVSSPRSRDLPTEIRRSEVNDVYIYEVLMYFNIL